MLLLVFGALGVGGGFLSVVTVTTTLFVPSYSGSSLMRRRSTNGRAAISFAMNLGNRITGHTVDSNLGTGGLVVTICSTSNGRLPTLHRAGRGTFRNNLARAMRIALTGNRACDFTF